MKLTWPTCSCLKIITYTFQYIRKNDRKLGGLTGVFSGDCHQIMLVFHKGGRPEIINVCLKSSPHWQHVTVLKMTMNMRVALAANKQKEFTEYLLKVSESKIHPDTSAGAREIKLDVMIPSVKHLAELCQYILPQSEQELQKPTMSV